MGAHLTLILGGVRSGKSSAAERLAGERSRVLFVATAEARDEEMAERIAAHQAARPASWDTLEEPVDLVAALRPKLGSYDTFLVDCVTLWVSNLMLAGDKSPDVEREIVMAAGRLLDLMDESGSTWILVSNEVGSGIVPASPLARTFRDVLGRVNQLLASNASRVQFMVAGIPLDLGSRR